MTPEIQQESPETATNRPSGSIVVPMTEEPDVYGQRHPIENKDLIRLKLQELEEELDRLPDDKMVAVKMAEERCPKLIDDDFKLMFLRCEVFNSDLAAQRYAKYWEKRRELFGDEKAFLPMTLSEACKDDEAALMTGYSRIVVGAKDPAGRSIVVIDPSKQEKNLYDRDSLARSMWYMIHAVLEDEVTQQRGVCFLACPRNTRLDQVDRTQLQMIVKSLQGRLPIRLSAVHIVHPPYFFAMIFKFIQWFMEERLKKRFKAHSGTDEEVLENLAEVGLTKSVLPTELGGDVVSDHVSWIKERAAQGK